MTRDRAGVILLVTALVAVIFAATVSTVGGTIFMSLLAGFTLVNALWLLGSDG